LPSVGIVGDFDIHEARRSQCRRHQRASADHRSGVHHAQVFWRRLRSPA
jgi:hypothetical protein